MLWYLQLVDSIPTRSACPVTRAGADGHYDRLPPERRAKANAMAPLFLTLTFSDASKKTISARFSANETPNLQQTIPKKTQVFVVETELEEATVISDDVMI